MMDMKATTNQLPPLTKESELLHRLAAGETQAFWQLIQPYRNYLFRCCLKWTNGNSTEAEDLLSQAMVKALDKLQDHAEKITNLRAWLTSLTRNLYTDIYRKRRRQAMQMEDIEEVAARGTSAVISGFDSPEEALLHHELGQYLRHAINSLPSRLRTPFILRYWHQIPYQDIAQQLALSLNNIYKRIQQARDILQKRLSRYFSGLDDARLDSSESSKKGDVALSRDDFAAGVAPQCLPPQDCGATTGGAIPYGIASLHAGGLPLQSNETIASDSIAPIPQNVSETINYQVTAICLETLHSGWYPSLSPLGWS
ncbi:RNA polymerase sigma factor [Laspinema olomoucense]|uniref:RNA polymerase sigma factor n=1 Tax=Laspinema olomoucense TaxID=3231600 RepID=UPI0021BABF8A|nr:MULTISPECIES: sigma-70 family RNA polymerase sigma factor [unclassified Laspinema]MCT7991887.1 sigma-70 family RNA polymerase sigma factor [Laspinema sp. D3a]MCT7996045.1 sigma-70 family RNA polymerase sigma factor [Laspinema sp. D3c]